jgi:hypothetical protein
VTFYFDPRCPWCYQTSRWARRLTELGEIELEWRPFSLEVVNRPEGTDTDDLEPTAAPALRTAVLLAQEAGADAVGPFYAALGVRTFETAPPPSDHHAMIRDSLAEASFDPDLCDRALADPETWRIVVESTEGVVERIGKLGVPALGLDGDDGALMFGPVMSDLPSDDDAVELWRHTAWMIRNDNFWELKRALRRPPDLPSVRWRMEQRAKEAAAAEQERVPAG